MTSTAVTTQKRYVRRRSRRYENTLSSHAGRNLSSLSVLIGCSAHGESLTGKLENLTGALRKFFLDSTDIAPTLASAANHQHLLQCTIINLGNGGE